MKKEQVIEMLSSIAKDKGFEDLSKYISMYAEVKTLPVYTITKMPEATCDGCQ